MPGDRYRAAVRAACRPSRNDRRRQAPASVHSPPIIPGCRKPKTRGRGTGEEQLKSPPALSMFTSLVTLGYQPYYCRMQEIITSKTGGRPYANMIKVGGIVVKFLCCYLKTSRASWRRPGAHSA